MLTSTYASQDLLDLQQKLTRLFQRHPLAVIKWNTALQVVEWNSAAASIFGYTQSEMSRRTVWGLCLDDDAESDFRRILEEFVAGGQSAARQIQEIYTKSGRVRSCEWYHIAWYDLEGTVIGGVSMVQDLTARQGRAQLPRESKEFLNQVLNMIAHPIVVKDESHRWIAVNPAFCDLIGHSQSAIAGKSDYDVFAPEYAERIWRSDDAVLSSGAGQTVEEWFTDAQGTVKTAIVQKSRFQDSTGTRFLVTSLHSQGVELPWAGAIEAGELALRQINSVVPGVIYQYKTDLQSGEASFAYLSPQCRELFEIEPETGLASADPVWQLIHGNDWPQVQASVAAAVRENRSWQDEFRICTPSGQEKWVRGQSEPTTAICPGITLHNGIFIDITDRKQAEQALQTTTLELEMRVQERTATLYHLVEQLKQVIRDRKCAEAALRTSERNLRSLFDNAHDAIFIHKMDGTLLDVNERMLQMYGVSREMALELSFETDYSSPDNYVGVLQEYWRRAIAGEVIQFEWQARRPYENRCFEVEVTLHQIQLDGEPVILANVRDISDRKAAEIALRQKEAQYRSIFESVRDGLIINDLETGMVVEANPAVCYMHGYAYHEFIGTHPARYIHASFHPLFEEFLRSARTGQAFSTRAIDVRQDGTQFDVEVVGTQFLYNGKLHGLSFVRDITEQVRNENDRREAESALRQSEARLRKQTQTLEATLQELQAMQAQLVQQEKMSSLGQLVAGVAHEINNPVSFIYGNIAPAKDYIARLLSLLDAYQTAYPEPLEAVDEILDGIDFQFMRDDLSKLLRSMEMGASRIKQIVLSLRTFSRVDESDFKAVDLHEGIESTLLILEHRLKAQRFRPAIKVMKEYGCLPKVQCHAGQLNQVLMNILVNAIDAIDDHATARSSSDRHAVPGQIQVVTELVDQEKILVWICDNGTGMTRHARERMFDPFFTTKPVGKGTGLGMSISYQIIEKHQGTIQCISAPGAGTSFIIELPVQQMLSSPNRSYG